MGEAALICKPNAAESQAVHQMQQEPLSRRLSAVLVADVAGYSRLMERDESGTHRRLRALLTEVIEPSLAGNKGRLLKLLGDGVLAEFQSATDALRCAVEIQRQNRERNRSVARSDRMELRIGINVADVLSEEADIAGGGVNLAARLEKLAPPGGICILEALREQIHDDLGVSYIRAGTRRVKNISKPVRVMHVLLDEPGPLRRARSVIERHVLEIVGLTIAVVAALVIAATFGSRKPTDVGPETLSLQIGAFRPASAGDETAAGVGRAISQQLYLALSAERHLLKIKGSPSETAGPESRPLARYVIEGVVLPVAGGYRVDARLVASSSRTTIWGDGFALPGTSPDDLALGARRIAHAMHGEVLRAEVRRIREAAPARPDSMDLVLLALDTEGTDASLARQRLEQALAVDARNVPALLALAAGSELSGQDRLTQRAVSTDPLCGDSWTFRAQVLRRLGQKQAAHEAIERASKIDPFKPFVRTEREIQLINDGKWAQVIRPLDEIEFEFAKAEFAHREMLLNQCLARVLADHDARLACQRLFASAGSEWSMAYATAAVARSGSPEEAADSAAKLKALYPAYTTAEHRARLETDVGLSPLALERLDAAMFSALARLGVPQQ